jgi:hypothetical protein
VSRCRERVGVVELCLGEVHCTLFSTRFGRTRLRGAHYTIFSPNIRMFTNFQPECINKTPYSSSGERRTVLVQFRHTWHFISHHPTPLSPPAQSGAERPLRNSSLTCRSKTVRGGGQCQTTWPEPSACPARTVSASCLQARFGASAPALRAPSHGASQQLQPYRSTS